jgi:hypothetical protein
MKQRNGSKMKNLTKIAYKNKITKAISLQIGQAQEVGEQKIILRDMTPKVFKIVQGWLSTKGFLKIEYITFDQSLFLSW